MIAKTMTYTDLNGTQRTETFYFNLSKSELLEMELATEGGYLETIEKIVKAVNGPELVRIFKELILKSYGEKSPDGRRFIKSAELSKAFSETAAYDQLFTELATNSKSAAAFVNGVIPSPEQLKEIKEIKEQTPISSFPEQGWLN